MKKLVENRSEWEIAAEVLQAKSKVLIESADVEDSEEIAYLNCLTEGKQVMTESINPQNYVRILKQTVEAFKKFQKLLDSPGLGIRLTGLPTDTFDKLQDLLIEAAYAAESGLQPNEKERWQEITGSMIAELEL